MHRVSNPIANRYKKFALITQKDLTEKRICNKITSQAKRISIVYLHFSISSVLLTVYVQKC